MEQIPCRVSADLRLFQTEQDRADRAREAPNFADENDLRLVVVDDLVEPLAELFATRGMIRMLQRSEAFREAVNSGKALEWLMRDLVALEQALLRRWEAS